MSGRLNLASRPFRNQRLPALVMGLALASALALTAGHGYLLWDLLSIRTSAVREEVAALDAEARRLEEEHRQQRVQTPDKATLAHWTALKDIVDQRAFSWTDFLNRLEVVQPRGVKFKSITPSAHQGQLLVLLDGNARTPNDLRDLVRALKATGDFRQIYPLSEGADEKPGEGIQIQLKLVYEPRPRPSPSPAASPSPGAGPAPQPSPSPAASAAPAAAAQSGLAAPTAEVAR